MAGVQKSAAVAVLLLAVSAAATGVTVKKGVIFWQEDSNSTVETGKEYSFNSITVHSDAVTFGGDNVSVVHNGSRTINATLWNYTLEEIVGRPSVKIGTNTSDGNRVTFNFTGAVQEREYNIKKEGDRLVDVDTGAAGILVWNESAWTGPANFTATLLETLQNATVIVKGSFDHPSDTPVVDDEENPSEGVYTDVGFGYGAFELAGEVAGVVPGGTFLQLRFTDTGSAYRFAQTQLIGDNIFLLPFTEGGHGVIEDRESAIQGSLFGGGNFLGFPDPSFAFELSETKTVTVSLEYDDIILDGFAGTVSPGTYTLTITNEGVKDGKTQVNVTVQ